MRVKKKTIEPDFNGTARAESGFTNKINRVKLPECMSHRARGNRPSSDNKPRSMA